MKTAFNYLIIFLILQACSNKSMSIVESSLQNHLKSLDQRYALAKDVNGIYLFPELEFTHTNYTKELDKIFIPVATIELDKFFADIDGLAHLYIVNTFCNSGKTNNQYCHKTKTTFKRVNNQYSVLCTEGHLNACNKYKSFWNDDVKIVEEQKQKFAKGQRLKYTECIERIGKSPEWIQNEEWPLNDNGEKLKFICQTDLAYYSGNFSVIYLFYDKKKEHFVQVSQVD